MSNKNFPRSAAITILLLMIFSSIVTAQVKTPLPGLGDLASKGPFISEKSNFIIALPAVPTSITQTKDVGSRSGGRGTRFTWNLREIDATVDHVIHPLPVMPTGRHMDEYGKLLKNSVMTVAGGRAKLIKEFSVGMLGISGVAMEYSTGSALIVAYAYARENEEFIIVGTAKPDFPDSEQMARNVTSSFRLNKAGVTVGGVTYNLPPGVTDPYTLLSMHKDRVDENIKGMVKSVVVESENALDDPPKRVRRSEKYYDSFGNVTREKLYSRYGKIINETIFTNDYLTNKRTSTTEPLYEGAQDSDKNFIVEYKYKHDSEGRTIQMNTNAPSGRCPGVMRYQRNKNSVKAYMTLDMTPCNGGKEVPISEDILNENGDEVKSMFTFVIGVDTEYTYEAFDAKGNWIKRNAVENKEDRFPATIEYRTIEYYR